jgi:hypothetical protein
MWGEVEMRFFYLYIIIILSLTFCFSASAQSRIKVIQFANCSDVTVINIDSIYATLPEDDKITLILFRAESTHTNDNPMINPLFDYLVDLDTSTCRVISYELKNTAGANNCLFKYATSKGIDQSKGVPPTLFITSKNKETFDYLKGRFQLKPYSQNSAFLINPELISTDSIFYNRVNKIIWSYNNLVYESKYFNAKKISGYEQLIKVDNKKFLIGITGGIGTFREQLKNKYPYTGSAKQSYSYYPSSYYLSFSGKYFLNQNIFIKGSVDFNYFITVLTSDFINQYPISSNVTQNQSYSILPNFQQAVSRTLIGSLSASAGYRYLHKFKSKSLPVNIDLGFGLGKMLMANSSSSFLIQLNDKSIYSASLYGKYTDIFSFYIISNPNIEIPIMNGLSLNLGMAGMFGISYIGKSNNYLLITDNSKFGTFEATSSSIRFQNILFTAGLTKTINLSKKRIQVEK